MKGKFFAFVLGIVLLCATNSLGQTLYPPDQSTMAWNAVTTFVNGATIPIVDTIKYDVYLSPDGLLGEIMGRVQVTQYTFTFTAEGIRYGGVRTVRIPQGILEANCTDQTCPKSTISWSNSTDPQVVPGGPFGWVNYLAPENVAGLRKP